MVKVRERTSDRITQHMNKFDIFSIVQLDEGAMIFKKNLLTSGKLNKIEVCHFFFSPFGFVLSAVFH